MMKLNSDQIRRYNRHLILDGFGEQGQLRLAQAKVLVVGVGGLGSPVALYLAAAGVGTLGLVDGDWVSLDNLQRQIIHTTPDVGRFKTESAQTKLAAVNPEVQVVLHNRYLSEDNALDLIREYDLVVDGTDNFATKYLINDACVMLEKPFSMGGINRYSGQLMTHLPGTACYRCLFPEPPAKSDIETCSTVGVLGSVAGVLGTLQATEVIKCIAQVGQPLTNALLTFDVRDMAFHRFDFAKNNQCALCGTHPSIIQLKEYAFQSCAKRPKTE